MGGLSGQVYDLHNFLDAYCWFDFVVNIIQTRHIKPVIVYKSKLGYLWAHAIRDRTSAVLMDIIAAPSREWVELSTRFDNFFEYHVELTSRNKDPYRYASASWIKKLKTVEMSSPDTRCDDILVSILEQHTSSGTGPSHR